MTPFDPIALLAMLRAFYPSPSAAALERARRERPEYFAGGEIVSTGRDKIRLPDGRVFDLIYDVDGLAGGPAWQVIEPGTGGDPDAIVLEPGPLVPIDVDDTVPPILATGFAEFAGPHLGELGHHERAIEAPQNILAGAANPDGLHATYDHELAPGGNALDNHLRTIGELDPSQERSNTSGLEGRIGDIQRDYPDPDTTAPPDLNVNPNRTERPPNEGEGSPWYQQ